MSKSLAEIANPKPRRSTKGRAHWYPYYAGYSAAFVEDAIDLIDVPNGGIVLDPWNGSGTTTAVCQAKSVRSQGIDLNPVMVVVGKARLLRDDAKGSLKALLDKLIQDAKAGQNEPSDGEPLTAWFEASSAARLRALQQALENCLDDDAGESDLNQRVNVLSRLASFFYVLFFRVARGLAGRITSSNPTWVKARLTDERKASASWSEISSLAAIELKEMELGFQLSPSEWVTCDVSTGSSESIAMPTGSIAHVVGSPPYMTRIDYAVATRIELAFLSAHTTFDAIREQLIGAVKLGSSYLAEPTLSISRSLLNRIEEHPSKASRAYYKKYFSNYLKRYENSMQELSRVTSSGGSILLVVQDSKYKEVHLDLAAITVHALSEYGFRLSDRKDFFCGLSMRGLNVRAAKYSADWKPRESVLLFRRSK